MPRGPTDSHHRCTIFLHIPKAAGQSFTTYIRRQFPDDSHVSLNTLADSPKIVEKIPPEVRANLRIVTGHVHYGIHRYFSQECRYITLLRDPVQRVVSLYRYIRRTTEHPLYEEVSHRNLDLAGFVESGLDRYQVENGQARQILGLTNEDPDDRALDQAKENLERHFLPVGLVERFDESVVLLRRAYGWGFPLYVQRNRAKADNEIPPASTLGIIRERNEIDLELYGFVERLFAKQIGEQRRSIRTEAKLVSGASKMATFVKTRLESRS